MNDDAEDRGIAYLDADGNEVTDVTWSSDFVYRLDNFVFVNDGETLNIEPGTLIQGMPGDESGRIGEHDGGTDPEDGEPFATSKVANATYIGVGPGVGGIDGDQGEPMLIQRDNNATSYYNAIFMDGRTTSAGLEIEDRSDRSDARERAENGDLVHANNLWWNVGADYDPGNTTFEDIIQITEEDGQPVDESWRGDLAQVLRDNDNQLTAESPIQAMNRQDDQDIVDFDPRAAGPATTTALSPVDGFGDTGGENADLVDVNYKGAFGPNDNWAKGWTLLDQNGELQ